MTATEVEPQVTPAHGAGVTLRGVRHAFGRRGERRIALREVDLTIEPGEFVVLVGPSGCGKSTVLNLIAGFLTPGRGEVLVDDRPVLGPDVDRGVVFQQPRLFPWMSVRRNVEFGPRMARLPRPEQARLADAALALVGLTDSAGLMSYELSGGMQQRAAIARALCGHPRVLLMDEPFAALDALTRERLQEELLRIWRATGTTIVFVTHSVDEAVFLGTRAIAFSARPGRIVLDLRLRPASGDARKEFGAGVERDRLDPELAEQTAQLRDAVRSAAALG